jgi:hypothetical protein
MDMESVVVVGVVDDVDAGHATPPVDVATFKHPTCAAQKQQLYPNSVVQS